MVAGQHYSQREWVLGKLSVNEHGTSFEIVLPLTFHGTLEIMKMAHDQFSKQVEVVGLQVTKHTLKWSASSFVAAEVTCSRVVSANLAAACKCGIFGNKPRRKKETSASASAPKPKPKRAATPHAIDDDAESDGSFLDEFVKFIEEELEADDEQEAEVPQPTTHQPPRVEVEKLLNAVVSSSTYKGSLPEGHDSDPLSQDQPSTSPFEAHVQKAVS